MTDPPEEGEELGDMTAVFAHEYERARQEGKLWQFGGFGNFRGRPIDRQLPQPAPEEERPPADAVQQPAAAVPPPTQELPPPEPDEVRAEIHHVGDAIKERKRKLQTEGGRPPCLVTSHHPGPVHVRVT